MKKKIRYEKKIAASPIDITWADRIRRLRVRLAREHKIAEDYLSANCDAVWRTVDGRGPDARSAHPSAGARITFNMSSVHVPGFCEATRSGKAGAYKNCYDLAAEPSASGIANHVSARRRLVDESLPLPDGSVVDRMYFGAVDVNGSGVRFYGDVCLVLRREHADSCLVLDRNSYDLVRSPVKERIARLVKDRQDSERRAIARSWSGSWQADLGHIVTGKALAILPLSPYRWTTGQISQVVCSDEDYIEVLKSGSFNAYDLQEARLSAHDIAEDALTTSRMASRRPIPRLESMLWSRRRSGAEAALRALGVPVRVVGNHTRTKA